MSRVTLQTIADRVGVSRMTVSNAFSRPDQLSAQMRRTILEAAADLGYVGPDPSARALARGTTGAVGVLLTESLGTAFLDPIAAAFFGAVAEELAPTGTAVVLLPSISQGMVPARDIPMDGALVYGCAGDYPAVDWLVRRRLPLVFVDGDAVGDASSVHLDEREGARLGAQHLLDLGHRRITILTMNSTAPPGWAPDTRTAGSGYVGRERQTGWVETLEAAGVTPATMEVHDNVEPYVTQGARAVLAGPDRPTAVLCFSDLMAAAVVHAADELGLRVPEDVSVVGYDDSPLARRLRPALTTVHQDFAAKGKAAAGALTAAIARFRAGEPPLPEHHQIPVDLVVRESTAPPAHGGRSG
ncbi:LacI family DNA-binding transcriptional regulator [Cellulomonas fengjieae]|uniref:LacI family DNA-binding transcriptional regulator n=1 Tax=Cellulomonas fengjieae TaxID=2819978 RepID=UPI001AAF1708|nr:LacI family DNA-binding transcriptional regulator [Cellulomonas fengjieae]MBO3100865.1 LacI family DNA-binding transcriptional regulator [Cellulomonas fengjieae]